jgi:hypothetical protein
LLVWQVPNPKEQWSLLLPLLLWMAKLQHCQIQRRGQEQWSLLLLWMAKLQHCLNLLGWVLQTFNCVFKHKLLLIFRNCSTYYQ